VRIAALRFTLSARFPSRSVSIFISSFQYLCQQEIRYHVFYFFQYKFYAKKIIFCANATSFYQMAVKEAVSINITVLPANAGILLLI